MSRFSDHTAVWATDDPGRLDCEIHDPWWVSAGPNGGYVAAIAARAFGVARTTEERPLRSLTMHYVRAPKPGPASIRVETVREGRSVTFARAELLQDDRLFATAQAVLAVAGDSVELHTPIDLPPAPAGDAEPALAPEGTPGFASQFAYLPTVTPGEGEAVTGGWLRLRDPNPLDEPMVAALTDSWFPALYSYVGRVLAMPTLDLTVHIRAPLPRPAEWAFVRVQTREAARGFAEEDAVVVAPDGTLLAQSRQLALVR